MRADGRATLFLAVRAASAVAQTGRRVSIGSHVIPTDSEVGSISGNGPVVGRDPRKGWGVASARNSAAPTWAIPN